MVAPIVAPMIEATPPDEPAKQKAAGNGEHGAPGQRQRDDHGVKRDEAEQAQEHVGVDIAAQRLPVLR